MRGYESLDTELSRITKRAATGKRVVDKLFKVFLVEGQEVWILVHVEVQTQYDQKFAARMYNYHNLLRLRYKRQVESMAILTDGNKRFRPSQFTEKGILSETNFKFGMVKLLDYKQRWTELEQTSNPFALVTMAHLKALELKGRGRERERLNWKIQLVKLLKARKLPEEMAESIYEFIDSIVELPEEMEEEFFEGAFEEEAAMAYVTTIERVATKRGIAKGREEGLQEGKQEGMKKVVLSLLNHKFERLDSSIEEQIGQFSIAQLQNLSVALLDFKALTDLTNWLQANSAEADKPA